MLDMRNLLSYPYEFELNLKIPDSMATELVKSLIPSKIVQDCRIIFRDGYFEAIFDLRMLLISKQIKLLLEIEQIELSKEVMIITLKEHNGSHATLWSLIGMLGKDLTSFLSISGDHITINLTDKWLNFQKEYDYIFKSWIIIEIYTYAMENNYLNLLLRNTKK